MEDKRQTLQGIRDLALRLSQREDFALALKHVGEARDFILRTNAEIDSGAPGDPGPEELGRRIKTLLEEVDVVPLSGSQSAMLVALEFRFLELPKFGVSAIRKQLEDFGRVKGNLHTLLSKLAEKDLLEPDDDGTHLLYSLTEQGVEYARRLLTEQWTLYDRRDTGGSGSTIPFGR